MSSLTVAGPWLSKAFKAFAIPTGDWEDAAAELFSRLNALLVEIQGKHANVHLVDTQGTLIPALVTDTDATEDWQNEIHPTRGGYKQLSAKWAPVLDAVL